MKNRIFVMPSTSPHLQCGVVLVAVLLVFFIASTLVVGMLDRQHLDIRKTANEASQLRLYQYAFDAEALASSLLESDYHGDSSRRDDAGNAILVDSYEESWAGQFAVKLSDGSIDFSLDDMHAAININDMFVDDELDSIATEVLKKAMLAAGHDLPEDRLAPLLDHFRVAGNFATIDEFLDLLSLKKASKESFEGCITAIPARMPMNLNTMSEFALEAYGSILVENIRDLILTERGKDSGMEVVPAISGERDRFAVSSQYFRLNAEVTFQDRDIFLKSVLYRNPDDGSVYALSREISAYPMEQTAELCAVARTRVIL
jgi:type II secretory pathway component PulK